MHYNLRLDDEWVPLRSERTSRRAGVVWECDDLMARDTVTKSSPIDRLNELPPLPRRTPTPRRTGRYVLLLVTILLIANAFVGERGLVALFRANREHAQLQQVIDALHAENGQLHRYVEALTEDPRLIEAVARGELDMIRPGEQLFIVRTTTALSAETAPIPPNADPTDGVR